MFAKWWEQLIDDIALTCVAAIIQITRPSKKLANSAPLRQKAWGSCQREKHSFMIWSIIKKMSQMNLVTPPKTINILKLLLNSRTKFIFTFYKLPSTQHRKVPKKMNSCFNFNHAWMLIELVSCKTVLKKLRIFKDERFNSL